MLLSRPGAKSSSEGYSRTRLGYFTIKAIITIIKASHAIVMKLHGHDVTLILETADLSGLREVIAGLVGGIRQSG